MSEEDLFYKDVEGRMEELKQKPIKKEKETRGEKISKPKDNVAV
ncbi:accessory Sec system protein Asp4, partial [Streptococcus pneumoniae]